MAIGDFALNNGDMGLLPNGDFALIGSVIFTDDYLQQRGDYAGTDDILAYFDSPYYGIIRLKDGRQQFPIANAWDGLPCTSISSNGVATVEEPVATEAVFYTPTPPPNGSPVYISFDGTVTVSGAFGIAMCRVVNATSSSYQLCTYGDSANTDPLGFIYTSDSTPVAPEDYPDVYNNITFADYVTETPIEITQDGGPGPAVWKDAFGGVTYIDNGDGTFSLWYDDGLFYVSHEIGVLTNADQYGLYEKDDGYGGIDTYNAGEIIKV
jgi:hypothetical protein